jgi:hypothetical protein
VPTTIEEGIRELHARIREMTLRMAKDEDDAGALWQFVKQIQMRFLPGPPDDCNLDFSNILQADLVTPCCIPRSLPFRDNYYGDIDLVYDDVNFWWRGCKQISYPGTALCTAQSAPIQYTLYGDDMTDVWTLEVAWHGTSGVGGNICPTVSKTCSDALNRTQTSNQTFLCPPDLSVWGFSGALQGFIYPVVGTTNVFCGYGQVAGCSEFLPWTLYANDSVYGAWTLAFNGVDWRGCRTVTTAAWTGADPCASVASALTLILLMDGTCQLKWPSATPGTTKCPTSGATCATTTNVTATSGALTINDCDPFDATVTVSGATWKAFGDAAATGVTIDFSATP